MSRTKSLQSSLMIFGGDEMTEFCLDCGSEYIYQWSFESTGNEKTTNSLSIYVYDCMGCSGYALELNYWVKRPFPAVNTFSIYSTEKKLLGALDYSIELFTGFITTGRLVKISLDEELFYFIVNEKEIKIPWSKNIIWPLQKKGELL